MSQEFLPTRERSHQIQSRFTRLADAYRRSRARSSFPLQRNLSTLVSRPRLRWKTTFGTVEARNACHFSEPYRGGQNPIFHGKPCRNVRDLFATSGADKVFTASVWGKKPFHFPRETRGFERRRVDTTLKKGWSASAATKIFNSRSSDVAANPIHDPPL